jgi:4'-phosphopantetheinyl transferase
MTRRATLTAMAARVDLWHVRTDALDARSIAACADLLTVDEREKHARFVFERHRLEYLATRGLARGVLATYLPRRPSELSFHRTALGRPILEDAGALRFNLTNTVTLIACAVTDGREIGVDAEPLTRSDQILTIASTVFTVGERAGLERLPGPARRRRAVELWTLKEAYIKARGLGFSLPVQSLEVLFTEGAARPPRLRFFEPLTDVGERWALATCEIEGHLVSTCTEVAGGEGADDPRVVEIDARRADLAALLA